MTELLRPGATCWRIAEARRLALLLDNEAYFAAVSSALRQARRSVLILGWEFDPRTPVCHGKGGCPSLSIGALLRALAEQRPQLDIRLLIWDMALPIAMTRGFFPQRASRWFSGSRVEFRLNDHHPPGASHHQKLVVIDGSLAFCSGGDFGVNRWDSAAHAYRDVRRRLPTGGRYPARHDLSAVLDGEAAAALAELAYERWARDTGEAPLPGFPHAEAPWPEGLAPDLTRCRVGIARTEPRYAGREAVRENEALYLEAIACARRRLYFENQYFASRVIAQALAARLREPDGPQVVVVLPPHSPGLMERLTMDSARDALLAHLRRADRRGRFQAWTPKTDGDTGIIVHSKAMVADDRLLILGSANLNNRSLGFDTECNLVIDAQLAEPGARAQVSSLIERFLGHLVGHYPSLQPLHGRKRGWMRTAVARYHLGDPEGTPDSFRPWRRRRGPACFGGLRD